MVIMCNSEEKLKELESLLDELSIELKYGKGNFQGGFCRYKDRKILYLNRTQSIDHRVSLIISELQKININLDERKISPSIRKLLHNSSIN